MIVAIYADAPQSGKSVVRRAFVNRGFNHVSFATPVKESILVVLKALNVLKPREYLWGDWKHLVIPELGVTGGWLMSTYATTYWRNMVNRDVWLNCLKQEIKPDKNYVIDDLRFPNEFDWLTEQKTLFIKVFRPDAPEHDRVSTSEGLLKGYKPDWAIYNNCDLLTFQARSTQMVKNIFKINQL